MPRSRFVLVLAKNAQQAATYAKRAGFKSGEYRAVAAASSIRGISVADAHILPDFHSRPDRHAILSEIRWARDVKQIDVEMPAQIEAPAKDQGDGMGEQLTIEDALADIPPPAFKVVAVPDDTPVPEHHEKMLARVRNEAAVLTEEDVAELDAIEPFIEPVPAPAPPKPRRKRCATCGRLASAPFHVDPEGHDAAVHTSGMF